MGAFGPGGRSALPGPANVGRGVVEKYGVPRLVDMLREGESGFAALQTRAAVVTMLPSDEFQACVKAGEETAKVEKDMSKCPHDLRDAHCLHGEAVISLVLRELKLCELKPD